MYFFFIICFVASLTALVGQKVYSEQTIPSQNRDGAEGDATHSDPCERGNTVNSSVGLINLEQICSKGFRTTAGSVYEYEHPFDASLSNAIISVAKTLGVLKAYDFGCGPGWYIEAFLEAGIEATGLDGNPLTASIPNCKVQDLTADFDMEPVNFVLSLEIFEHAPKEFEEMLVSNINKLVAPGGTLVLSWAVGQKGFGHVNCQNNDYVIRLYEALGYTYDQENSAGLRKAARHSWFTNTVFVFKKRMTSLSSQITVKQLLSTTYFINLESRIDRLHHVQKELAKIGVEGTRFNAIRTAEGVSGGGGAIGCSLSHLNCLERAKASKAPFVFICEDDIQFLDPELFLKQLGLFSKNIGSDWDVLIVSGNLQPPYLPIGDYCARVKDCLTTTGYIVQMHYYDALIANIKEGLELLISNYTNKREFSIDVYWKRLQSSGKWYMITPLTVVQREGFSDIEGKYQNNKHLLTDLNKVTERLMHQEVVKAGWSFTNTLQSANLFDSEAMAAVAELGYVSLSRKLLVLPLLKYREDVDSLRSLLKFFSDYIRFHEIDVKEGGEGKEGEGESQFSCYFSLSDAYRQEAPPYLLSSSITSTSFQTNNSLYLPMLQYSGDYRMRLTKVSSVDVLPESHSTSEFYPMFNFPVISFGRHKYDESTILIPDPLYVWGNGFSDTIKAVVDVSVAWELKIDKMFWRGTDTKFKYLRGDARGQRRILMDLVSNTTKSSKYSFALSDVVDADFIPSDYENNIPLQNVEHMSRFKYLLEIDGSASSFTSMWLKFATKGLVFKVDSHLETLSSRHWIPWIHFIPIKADLSDLQIRFEWARNHDKQSQEMADAAYHLAIRLKYNGALAKKWHNKCQRYTF